MPEVTLITRELLGSSSSGPTGIEDFVSKALSELADKILIGSQEQTIP